MEALAAVPRRAKRRKPEAPKSPEPEGGANISSGSESNPPGAGGAESHMPGAAGEEEDGVDRISHLPDAILGDVISLLPTKEAARTRILATRWRHLWRSAPLNLDSGELRTVGVVSLILSSHGGPGRRFRFPAHHLQDHPATVDAWLRSPALDNLQEIDCWTRFSAGTFGCRTEVLQLPPPPASAFRFSSCLCVATFSSCHLSDDITQALHFPMLKKLALQQVDISEDSLHSIIAASPVLECFLLHKSFGFRCVRINSACLTSIGVSVGFGFDRTMNYLEEFIVEDAPCLIRILYLRSPPRGTHLRVSVISAPNLETLGCLSYDDESRLTLGSTIVEPCFSKGFRMINSTMPTCTVKILAFHMCTLSLDVTVDLMRCFPCLEKLYILHSYLDGEKNLWRYKHRNLIKCLDIRLKTIVLNNYRGTISQVSFATFFVRNAKMLESMTFECERDSVTDRFLAEQHQLLELEGRASRCARFYFTIKRCEHEFMHINHAHDLSKTDPFECEERGVGICASFE